MDHYNSPITSDKTGIVEDAIVSTFLGRVVKLTILLPPGFEKKPYPVLWLNDGQDIPSLQLSDTLNYLYEKNIIRKLIVIGIHAGENRLQEYGTIGGADFRNRGARAGLFAEFLINELLPAIRKKLPVSLAKENNTIAGSSLGGLSAFDCAWNHPDIFGRVGVFSGSFWWRDKALNRGYKENKNRIILQLIRSSEKKEGLRFWFEAGTEDEKADRNKNGVIDSIDDTVDLIKELKTIGYNHPADIQFILVKGGEHNQETWAEAMPYFLKWAFDAD